MSSKNISSNEKALVYFQRGLDLFNKNKFKLANNNFKKAISDNPHSDQAFYYRGKILL
jgi:Tfp pilus assembly protein PilF